MTIDPKAQQANEEATKTPNKDDVHEQREKDQPAQGLVEKPVSPKKG